MKSRDGFAVVFTVVLVSACWGQTVEIPDANLRQVIVEALSMSGVHTITQADLLALTGTLKAQERGIVSLKGLEYATNLESLVAYGNQITDIDPLASLTKLKTLDLGNNKIVNCSAVANLTNLTKLWLARNSITDVSPLAVLSKLTYLSLRENQIANLTPLARLVNLKTLYLYDNQITDIGPLASLVNIETLYLYNNQITSIGPLATMRKMKALSLHDNQITDISPLANMANIEILYVHNNQITHISPLAGLVNLKELMFTGNRVADLTPVAGLTKLTTLAFSLNHVSDISPVAGLTDLEMLAFTCNSVTDISPLSGLTNLKSLQMSGNQIADIGVLAELTNIEELMVYSNQITDLAPVAGMKRLHYLWAYNNAITDLKPLRSLSEVRELLLMNNRISDISPLANCVDLIWLDLRANPLNHLAYSVYVPLIRQNNPLDAEAYTDIMGMLIPGGMSCDAPSSDEQGDVAEDFENGFDNLDWSFEDGPQWQITSTQYHSATHGAQAGAIGDNARSTMSIQLPCTDGEIVFWRKVSCEQNHDLLQFCIDGRVQSQWSGELDWAGVSLPVQAGVRTFSWTYSKDAASSVGQDTTWIDDITFPAMHLHARMGQVLLSGAQANQQFWDVVLQVGLEEARRTGLAALRSDPVIADASISHDGTTILLTFQCGLSAGILTDTEDMRGTRSVTSASRHENQIAWPSPSYGSWGSSDTVATEYSGSESRELTPDDSVAIVPASVDEWINISEHNHMALVATCHFSQSVATVASLLVPWHKKQERLPTYGWVCEPDTSLSLELVKRLDEYGLVYIATHGRVDEHGDVCFLAGSDMLSDEEWAVEYENANSNVFPCWTEGDSLPWWEVKPSFVRKHCPSFSHTFVYVSACHSLENLTMARAFTGNGAEVYVGWTNAVGNGFASATDEYVFDWLGGCTIGEVFEFNAFHYVGVDLDGKEFTSILWYEGNGGAYIGVLREM